LVRAGFHRAHPFTGLRVRLLGPGVSLGLHSAEIQALRGEFTDAVMMRGYDRVASRFTPDSALRMPGIPVGLADREEIRARGQRVPPTVSSTTRLRQVTCTERMNSLAAHGDARDRRLGVASSGDENAGGCAQISRSRARLTR
jgi:hypothetical protein